MSQAPDQANIVRLYEVLGVRPEEGVGRLTERYRQRLRALHPDKRFDSGQLDSIDERDSSDDLGWLTRSYREATAFARAHGHLPGADRPARPAPVQLADSGSRLRIRAPRRGASAVRRRLGWRWLIAIGAVVGAVLLTAPELLQTPDVTPFSDRLGGTVVPREAPVASAPGKIRIGSSMEDVRRIQGEPSERSDGMWQYGPSFVRFENGRVRNWHSSPLQPLRVDEDGS